MEKRKGKQDPTIRIALPYKVTDGNDAADLFELTGSDVLEWQHMLIRDILARNPDGEWTHIKYGYSVPRQNGKGGILEIRELYGLAAGERILHTAHLVSTSHKAFERLCSRLDKLGITYKSIKAKGQELIEVTDGGRVEFRTRTGTGGLGESYDVLIIDEAQEYKTDQESALTYVISASQNPQTIMCGTPPTPVSSGTVFRDFRDAVLSGESMDAGWVEWSIPEYVEEIRNKDLWYQTNPSLGILIKEREVSGEIGRTEDKIIDFNIQRLGLWIRENQKSAIRKADWDKLLVYKIPQLTGKMDIGIKYNKNGESVSVAMAARTAEGKIFFEVLNRMPVRNDVEWIIEFLQKTKAKINKVVVDGANRQQIIEAEMKKKRIPGCILPTVQQVIDSYAVFEKNIYEENLCRMDQPALTDVVTNCEKRRIGSRGGFGYQAIFSDMDDSLMDAVILASWAVEKYPEPKKQRIRC